MSVTAASREKRDQAKEKLKDIVNELKDVQRLITEAIDEDTWGADDLRDDYKEKLENVELEMISTQRLLIKIKNLL